MQRFQQKLRRQIILDQVIDSIIFQHVPHIFVIIIAAENNGADFRILQGDAAHQLIPVHPVHLHIRNHNLRPKGRYRRPGLGPVAAFPADGIALFFPVNQRADRHPAQQLVIHQ